jgi:hypothetical protein
MNEINGKAHHLDREAYVVRDAILSKLKPKMDAMKTDTSNRFGVVIKESLVQLTNWAPLFKPLNKIQLLPLEALNLAVWIFALSSPASSAKTILAFPAPDKEIRKTDGKVHIPFLPVCAFELTEPRMRMEDALRMAAGILWAVDPGIELLDSYLGEIKGL